MIFTDDSKLLVYLLLITVFPNFVSAKGLLDTARVNAFIEALAILNNNDAEWARRFDIELDRVCQEQWSCEVSCLEGALRRYTFENQFGESLIAGLRLVARAREAGDDEVLLRALEDLSDIYRFLHDDAQLYRTLHLIKDVHTRLGDMDRRYYFEALALEGGFNGSGENDYRLLARIDSIKQLAEREGCGRAVGQISLRMLHLYDDCELHDLFERQVAELETLANGDFEDSTKNVYRSTALISRGDVLARAGKLAAAKRKYELALGWDRRYHYGLGSPWRESMALTRLAKLAWEQRREVAARAYLDTALSISGKYELWDLRTEQFQLRVDIAYAGTDFAEAYRYLHELRGLERFVDSISTTFDQRRYRLQKAVAKLEREQRATTLALVKGERKANAYILLGSLAGAMVIFLVVLYIKNRRDALRGATRNREIIQRAENLTRLGDAKDQFLANVSHELRTPLTLLLDPVLRLREQEEGLTDTQQFLVDTAIKGGESLRLLARQLLNLARLDADRLEPRLEPVPLEAYFKNVFEGFQSTADRLGVSYDFDARDSDDPARIDPELTRQITTNLLTSAFRSTPRDGEVKARAYADDEWLTISVSDSGKGVAPRDRQKIFERFFQREQADTPAAGCLGIGLALTHEYTRLLGGHTELSDTPGGGATFTVTLPFSRTAVAAMEQTPEPLERTAVEKPASTINGVQKLNFVLVEDDPQLLHYLERVLSERFSIVTFTDGAAAWAHLEENARDCDLILSDDRMPIMDGLQLLAHVRQFPATQGLPFILLTERADRRDRINARRLGVDDCILKPFTTADLLDRLLPLAFNREGEGRLPTNEETQRRSGTPPPPDEPTPVVRNEEDREWLLAFEAFVRSNLADAEMTVKRLAGEFAMSESTLLRQVKRLTGLTAKQYLTEMRLGVARQLLENGSVREAREAGKSVGYTKLGTFNRQFKRRFGNLPSRVLEDALLSAGSGGNQK